MLGACRARRTRLVALLTCVLAAALIWTYSREQYTIAPSSHPKPRRLARDITIVIRQFEEFDHDLAETARTWSSALGGAPALIVVDRPLYPPVERSGSVRNSSIREVYLDLSLTASPQDLDPLFHVQNEFVLIVPDGTRPPTKRMLRAVLARAVNSPINSAIVLPGSKEQQSCQNIYYSYRDWTLRYVRAAPGTLSCDGVRSRHGVLIRTELLRQLPRPFLLPFPEALYLQTSVRRVQLQLYPEAHLTMVRLPAPGPQRSRSARMQRERRVALYRQLGVKRLLREDGDVQWYGCTRDSERCFPTAPGVPAYLTSSRNTPPCCLRHLQRTTRHALRVLLTAGARCWLEASTLLGAVTKGELMPFVDRAEIGIHSDDVARVPWLRLAGERGEASDGEGYAWERAVSGHYYRLAYSTTNRIYVDILPFLPRNGTMTKDGWFIGHQKEFPDHYLHPMSSVKFAGISAPAPNNVRDFLQIKFGPNIMENYEKIGYKLIYP